MVVWRLGLISDFSIQNLALLIENSREEPKVKCFRAPYGQIAATILNRDSDFWENGLDAVVAWSQPDGAVKGFGALLDGRDVSREMLLDEVDQFCSMILDIPDKIRLILVPIWTVPGNQRGLGLTDLKDQRGLALSLMDMNLRLVERLADDKRIFVLNADRWIKKVGSTSFDPKLWYMAKTPFSNDVFKEAVSDIKAAMQAVAGSTRKLIIVDLDETLWGGVVGEVGWQSIRLGGHDPIGEAFADFQRSLKRLTRRGVILGIVSKNDEATALEAIRKHPEMVLQMDDFAGWRINWEDKARNILDLARDLNLGIDSVVFLDDNPLERARVRDALPQVLVPDMPESPMGYVSALHELSCFELPYESREDKSRSLMYASERKRKRSRDEAISLEEWLRTLQMSVKVEILNEVDLMRAVQLLNKTNQMNLSTRRMTENELRNWIRDERNKMWTFRVSDKYGDSGLTGIASLIIEGDKGRMLDFILSCRIMGRGVEEAMLSTVIRNARIQGLSEIYAQYTPTDKNMPCRRFLEMSKLEKLDTHTYRWNCERTYVCPWHLAIEDNSMSPDAAALKLDSSSDEIVRIR